jgi:hypothetical protein
VVWAGLFLRTLGTPLFAGSFLNMSWAEDSTGPLTSVLPLLAGAEITSQLNYSCPSNHSLECEDREQQED